MLNQQVKRNIGRFPERYMLQLTQNENDRLRSQNVILKRGQHLKYMPYAFTEHGILMQSSVYVHGLFSYCFDPKAMLFNPLWI